MEGAEGEVFRYPFLFFLGRVDELGQEGAGKEVGLLWDEEDPSSSSISSISYSSISSSFS